MEIGRYSKEEKSNKEQINKLKKKLYAKEEFQY